MSTIINVVEAFKLNQGYVQCSEEEADLSYLIAYSQNEICNWLTISGSHWNNNAYDAASDPLALSKIFQQYSIQFTTNSNGAALLELSNASGESAGTIVVGTPILNRYNSTEINKEAWNCFLSSISSSISLDEFVERLSSSETDVASQISMLFPIHKEQLLADIDSEPINCDYVKLYFKKQSETIKKVTVKSVFKRIYGKALEPLGYKWAKVKEPCFIRVINEEIIHIIGIHDMKPSFIVPFGGVTTLYRANLMLDKTYRDTANWLPSVRQFWGWTHTDTDDAPDPRIGSKFYYNINSSDSIENVVSAALNETIRWILPALDSVQSLQDFPNYYERCYSTLLPFCTLPLKSTDFGTFEADAVIRYLLGSLDLQFQHYNTEISKCQALNDAFDPKKNSPDNIQYLRNRAKARMEAIYQSVISFDNQPEIKQQALSELQRRRDSNLKTLHTYGVL
jgi:hypothetical protein